MMDSDLDQEQTIQRLRATMRTGKVGDMRHSIQQRSKCRNQGQGDRGLLMEWHSSRVRLRGLAWQTVKGSVDRIQGSFHKKHKYAEGL